MDFATLKTGIAEIIGRAPANICYTLTTTDVNNTLRVDGMQATVTFTAVAEYTLPDDFLEVVSVYSDNSGYRRQLMPLEPETFDAQHAPSGAATVFSIDNGVMRINGTEGGDITLRYFAKLPELVADSSTNAVLTDYPAVYTYGVLRHHAALIRNTEALAIYVPAFDQAVKDAKRANRALRMGGIPGAPHVRSTP